MPVNIKGGRKQAERVPSTIQFPYSDMSDAVAVAEGLLKGGGVPLSRDQLAAAMGLAPGGGGFATKVATARTFGILESVAGKYQLTEIGYEIVDPGRQMEAKVKAFLTVPLFKRAYDEFRGKLLPPRPHGLEAAFVSFGVTTKNARHARLAFEKSARMAGFYPGGNEDRLVMPFGQNLPVVVPDDTVDQEFSEVDDEPNRRGGVVRLDALIHPSIRGMLDELPPPKSEWTIREQAAWLQALATLFPVIYKSKEEAALTVKVLRQVVPKEPEE